MVHFFQGIAMGFLKFSSIFLHTKYPSDSRIFRDLEKKLSWLEILSDG
jgi:hypothetical protein